MRLADLSGAVSGDRLQAVHAILVDGVGVPGVGAGSTVNVEVLRLDGDLLHGAVGEDGSSISGLVVEVAGGTVVTGDEHIGVLGRNELNASQITVLVKVQVVGGVLHVAVVELPEHFLVIQRGIGIAVLGAGSGDIGTDLEGVDLDVLNGLGGGDDLNAAARNVHENDVAILVIGDGKVLTGDGLGLGVGRWCS